MRRIIVRILGTTIGLAAMLRLATEINLVEYNDIFQMWMDRLRSIFELDIIISLVEFSIFPLMYNIFRAIDLNFTNISPHWGSVFVLTWIVLFRFAREAVKNWRKFWRIPFILFASATAFATSVLSGLFPTESNSDDALLAIGFGASIFFGLYYAINPLLGNFRKRYTDNIYYIYSIISSYVFSLIWLFLAYGIIDAMFINTQSFSYVYEVPPFYIRSFDELMIYIVVVFSLFCVAFGVYERITVPQSARQGSPFFMSGLDILIVLASAFGIAYFASV
ncbi:MAG: hypothetical protein HLUCCA04_02830 [Oceanicaulis sp. HLUCCA04]|nr:MAG: hypothetical protein HLUCCA04_02830 [Oceanicaulis sp. HLUCCA04]